MRNTHVHVHTPRNSRLFGACSTVPGARLTITCYTSQSAPGLARLGPEVSPCDLSPRWSRFQGSSPSLTRKDLYSVPRHSFPFSPPHIPLSTGSVPIRNPLFRTPWPSFTLFTRTATYSSLMQRIPQIAHSLRTCGVDSNT